MDNSNNYYQSRHFQRLLHRYEKAVAEGRVPYLEADELTDIAEYYISGKEDKKANQAIQAALDMHPGSVDPQIFLARQKMYYGELDEAHAIIDAITEQDDCEVVYIQAEILIKENRDDEASDFLLQKMDAMQDCLDTYVYDCVSIFMDYDRWEKAAEWLERLKEVCPDHQRLPIMEAEIFMGLDRYEDALPLLQEIIDDSPYCSEAWDLLAETHVALEEYAKALETTDYALAINPEDSNALLMKANALMYMEQTAEAIDLFKRCLEYNPDDLNVQITLSICYCNEERYQEALPLLDKAEKNAAQRTDKDAELSQILQLKAIVMSRLDKFHDALNFIDDAKKVTPDDLMWKCYLTEGDIYLRHERLLDADTCYNDALNCSPNADDTLFSIALSYMNAGYNEEAIYKFHEVWTSSGTEEGKFVVPYIANCFLQMGDMANYITLLEPSPSCNREATIKLFGDRYPGIAPEDYYTYAFKDEYGVTPQELLGE